MSEKNEISNKKNITKSLVLKPCGEIVYEKNNNIRKNFHQESMHLHQRLQLALFQISYSKI